ncbi:shikimate dehydrogenase [Pseudorhodoferax sp. LjRoot39]|uniref:shikimate dehydrogenase family protein n=1 Tax=Pseudorhodoferax sp. LjRoot39 TaxID=3342328 RepID=UPI003ECF1D20
MDNNTTQTDQPTVRVDGHTRLVPLLAYPSAHVRTPAFFNRHCVEHGIAAVMLPWKLAPDGLAAAMQAVRQIDNISGLVVTIPHKQEMARYCDVLEGTAARIQVCNVVRKARDGRLVGRMLDGLGFVQGLRDQGIDPAGRHVLLAGAGGAATAVAFELLASGATALGIVNRSVDKAEELVGLLRAAFPAVRYTVAPRELQGYDLAVNATALGMHAGDALPFDPDRLDSGATVAEVVMQPDTTALLQRAAARGLRIHKGVHMVTAQVRLLVEFTTAPD